jgi:hypothetical protein
MAGQHAKRSPSGAHRWMRCAGSVAAEAPYPRTSNAFAAEGTAMHEVGALCLDKNLDAADFLGHVITVEEDVVTYEIEITQEHVDAVQVYVDYCRSLPGGRFIEEHMQIIDEVHGTADFISIGDGVLEVVDLKGGRGEKVSAVGNEQLRLYGHGALNEFGFLYDVETIRLTIVQPRLGHIETETMSVDELRQWIGDEVETALAASTAPDAPRTPGEKQCRWCAHKANCPELAAHSMAVAQEGFDAVDDVADLSLEKVGEILSKFDMIENWIKAVRDRAYRSLEKGEEVPGWKLVAGRRGTRKWSDDLAAEMALRKVRKIKVADILPPKLISPAQAEKLIGKDHKILAEMVVQSDGKPTIAPADDRRPALSFDPTDGFEQVTAK